MSNGSWRPMSEAPIDGTEILATDYDSIEIISREPDFTDWSTRDGGWFFPAFWQPLPEQMEIT
jgi:hypothetical protein